MSVRVPSMGQIDLFKNYLYMCGEDFLNNLMKGVDINAYLNTIS